MSVVSRRGLTKNLSTDLNLIGFFRNRDFLFFNRACSSLPPLNDEDCFVINPVLFPNLPQLVVVFCGVFQ